MTANADIVREMAARLGMSVANLSDEQLERVAADMLAEFGVREVTGTEFASVIWRYQPGRPSAAAPAPKSPYKPRLAPRDAIEFEAAHPPGERVDGQHRERAIREQLGVTPVIYELALIRAMDDEACIRAHPMLCARLRRTRDRRAMLRSGKVAGA